MICLLLIKKKKRERENDQGAFFPGQVCPAGCAMVGFSRLVGAIKSCFKGQSLNLMCT
jgi:hypothetical protein